MHRHMRIHEKEQALSMGSEGLDGSYSPLSSLSVRTPRSKKRSGDDCSETGTPTPKRKLASHDAATAYHPAAKKIIFDKDVDSRVSGVLNANDGQANRDVFNRFHEVCSLVVDVCATDRRLLVKTIAHNNTIVCSCHSLLSID